ncbi:hypothetical protein GCM10009800_20480 [Nocardiopsis rhodophaea]
MHSMPSMLFLYCDIVRKLRTPASAAITPGAWPPADVELMTMSILPLRRRQRVRPYIRALEARRSIEERHFRQFAALTALRVMEVTR